MSPKSKAYIVLQESISVDEEEALKQAAVNALSPVSPPHAFVEDLGRNLIAEARRRQDTQQQRHHVARTVGIVGGGVLSVVSGFAIWFFVQRHQKQNGVKMEPPSTPSPMAMHAGQI
jgi:hypothetical protein